MTGGSARVSASVAMVLAAFAAPGGFAVTTAVADDLPDVCLENVEFRAFEVVCPISPPLIVPGLGGGGSCTEQHWTGWIQQSMQGGRTARVTVQARVTYDFCGGSITDITRTGGSCTSSVWTTYECTGGSGIDSNGKMHAYQKGNFEDPSCHATGCTNYQFTWLKAEVVEGPDGPYCRLSRSVSAPETYDFSCTHS